MNTKTAEPTNGTQLKWKPVTTARDLKQVETRTEVCDTHGEFLSLRFLNIWSICDQCIEEANHQQEAAETARRLANRVAAANIPPRFSGKTLDAYITETNDQKLALETARAYVNGFPVNRKVGRCLVFLGGVGTGKTLLACGIADCSGWIQAAVHDGKRVHPHHTRNLETKLEPFRCRRFKGIRQI